MTVKEIAKFTKKSETTIQRWLKKAACKMQSVADKMQSAGHGKITDYTIDEVEAILQSGSMSKDAVSILMENARSTRLSAPVQSDQNGAILQILQQQQQMMAILMSKVLGVTVSKKETLPAPKKSSRAELSQIVRQLAQEKMDGNFQAAWRELYREILYRCNTNVSVCSKNRGISGPAYLEEIGMLDTAVSIAMELTA